MQYLTVQYLLAMESLKLLIINLNILVAVTSNFFNPYWCVTRMEDARIPKDMLYRELCLGTRPTCRPELRFKDVCKWDMKACDIDTSSWKTAVHNRTTWRKITHDGMKKNDKSVIINGRKRETNHHLNLQQILPSNVTAAAKSVDQGSDFTATGYAVFKNNSTKAQSPLSNMTSGCQQQQPV